MAVPRSRLKTLKQEERGDPATKKKRSKAAEHIKLLRAGMKGRHPEKKRGGYGKDVRKSMRTTARYSAKVPPRGDPFSPEMKKAFPGIGKKKALKGKGPW
tara:strand:- start:269 stop:568 length:300 start_codon:yes stop_codon:yes gene_type:complete